MKQFETHCKYCGRKIIMTRDEANGRWVPCDIEICKYRRSGGPFSYIDVDGKLRRGLRTHYGDAAGEWGYQMHRASCTGYGRKAV